jgi:uncharacterized protein YegL
MKKDLTELVFILDRSGSMSGLESDTIGGFNALLEKQRKESGECIVTTVLFDDKYELLHDRLQLKGVSPITDSEYFVRGSTALLDAIGRTIDKIANVQKRTAESERAGKIMFVIITDGMENASREYRMDRVKEMVEREQNQYGWEFLFLGANIDAIETASHFGFRQDRAVNYCADSVGTKLSYRVLSKTISHVRAGESIGAEWKQEIERDHQTRSKRKPK